MATIAADRSAEWPAARRLARTAVARRTLRDARVRTIAFAYLFAAVAFIQPISYRHTYPTIADRLSFAHAFGTNKAVVLFYGKAYDLLRSAATAPGAWAERCRSFAAVFGLLAAVRALRAEEDTGRAELVLAGIIGRRTAYLAADRRRSPRRPRCCGWRRSPGSVAGGLAVGGSAYLALAVVSPVPVFAGVGAIASQLAPTRRIALELGGAVTGLAFLLRGDRRHVRRRRLAALGHTAGLGGGAAAVHGRPALVLLLPVVASVLLVGGRRADLARPRHRQRRACGPRSAAPARLALLVIARAQALRGERASLLVWLRVSECSPRSSA